MRAYTEYRQKAFEGLNELSAALLNLNPHLIYHPPVNPKGKSAHYTIYEDESAVCCTATEGLILAKLAELINPNVFIEIGSYAGWSSCHILQGLHYTIPFIAVDNFSECNNPDLVKQVLTDQLKRYTYVYLVQSDSVQFLNSFLYPKFDCIFIDGFHRDNQPLKDVIAACKVLSDNGFIILHDTWMEDVKEASEYLIDNGFDSFIFNTDNYLGIYSKNYISKGLIEQCLKILV